MANIIKIKRGSSANLDSLTLQEGELATTTDTRKLYIGNADGTKTELGQQGPQGVRGTKWWVGDFYSQMFDDANNGDLLLNTSEMSPGEVLQFYDGMWDPVTNIRGPQGPQGEKGEPGESIPIGSIIPYGNSVVPETYLLCNGQAVSRTDYPELFAIIGTTFGSGDGSTTFNVPDYRDKFALGAGGDVALAETGGEKEVTLTIDEMPAHTHPVKDRVYNVQFGRNDGGNGSRNPIGGTGLSHGVVEASSVGGGQAHNNMPPYVGTYYIIKAKQSAGVVASVVDNLFVNVMDFGAKGNGTTDDTQAIQDAINSVATSDLYDTVYIPNGTYLISQIKLKSNVKIKGDGFNTILKSIDNNPNNSVICFNSTNVQYSSVENLCIKGNRWVDSNNAYTDGIRLDNEGGSGDCCTTLRNLKIVECAGNGIHIMTSVRETRIDNCLSQSNELNGLLMDEDATDNFVYNCSFYDNKQNGVFNDNAANNKYINCNTYWNGYGDNSVLEDDTNILPNGTQDSKYIKRYHGFNISRTVRCMFTNCSGQENFGHGMYLNDSHDNIFASYIGDCNGNVGTGNTLVSLGIEAIYSGLYIKNSSLLNINGIFDNFKVALGTGEYTQKYAFEVYNSNDLYMTISSRNQVSNYNSENDFTDCYIMVNNDLIAGLENSGGIAGDIPTKVSQLENDSNFATEDYVTNAISTAIGSALGGSY